MTDSTPDDVPASRAVVEAVAVAEGVDPTELSPPLYTAIDPDVLDELFSRDSGGERAGQLVFEYLDYEVTVRAPDEVQVVETDGDGNG